MQTLVSIFASLIFLELTNYLESKEYHRISETTKIFPQEQLHPKKELVEQFSYNNIFKVSNFYFL